MNGPRTMMIVGALVLIAGSLVLSAGLIAGAIVGAAGQYTRGAQGPATLGLILGLAAGAAGVGAIVYAWRQDRRRDAEQGP